jgi:uracil-DNA glycosylase
MLGKVAIAAYDLYGRPFIGREGTLLLLCLLRSAAMVHSPFHLPTSAKLINLWHYRREARKP